ncbi:pachytene checkpoint protein 2 [Cladochytrium replicatum]|nr:pachytene checkpoint protein 2 [Cladochytrium replicatum]
MPVVHVEVCLHPWSTARLDYLKKCVELHLRATIVCAAENVSISLDSEQTTTTGESNTATLSKNCAFIRICELDWGGQLAIAGSLLLEHVDLAIHIYHLNEEKPVDEINEEENVVSCTHQTLPSRDLDGLWDSLIFDTNIPKRLLDYISMALTFADRSIDSNIITFNKVMLLHGPPGTGKTSLCRALAQKLAIRLSERYAYGRLVEINSHSLFSKYFSESGKLVGKMFQQLNKLVDNEESFVVVLVDEVESLTAARKTSISGLEPSDAVRVVNALLTQIDNLRRRKNVLILTTSNIQESIDEAFIDRADIKQYIGPPSAKAIYAIFCSCISELMQRGMIQPSIQLMDWREIDLFHVDGAEPANFCDGVYMLAKRCVGLSGRALRKLPILSYAFFVKAPCASPDVFLHSLDGAIKLELESRRCLTLDSAVNL